MLEFRVCSAILLEMPHAAIRSPSWIADADAARSDAPARAAHLAAARSPRSTTSSPGANAELLARLRALARRAVRGARALPLGRARQRQQPPAARRSARPGLRRRRRRRAARRGARRSALFNAINAARESGGTVLAAGNAPPAQLPLREDLKSAPRLGPGLPGEAAHRRGEGARHLHARGRARGMQAVRRGGLLPAHPRAPRPALAHRGARRSSTAPRWSSSAPITLPLVRELIRKRWKSEAVKLAPVRPRQHPARRRQRLRVGPVPGRPRRARARASTRRRTPRSTSSTRPARSTSTSSSASRCARSPSTRREDLDALARRVHGARASCPMIGRAARALVRRPPATRATCAPSSPPPTASSPRPIAREFGVPHLIATEPEARDGRFTGRVARHALLPRGQDRARRRLARRRRAARWRTSPRAASTATRTTTCRCSSG